MNHREAIAAKGCEGFTLVEMLLVMLLIAIMAGAAVVNLKDRQDRYAMRATATDLGAALRYAAARARMEGCVYQVRFANEGREYRVERMQSGEGASHAAPGRAGASQTLGKGVRVSGIWPGEQLAEDVLETLDFGPGGEGFFGRIELRSRGGQVMRIQVAPWTKQVLIEE